MTEFKATTEFVILRKEQCDLQSHICQYVHSSKITKRQIVQRLLVYSVITITKSGKADTNKLRVESIMCFADEEFWGIIYGLPKLKR